MLTRIPSAQQHAADRSVLATRAQAAEAGAFGLTPAERLHWREERAYWWGMLRDWFARHYVGGLHAVQDDDATVPPPRLVAQIQTQRKCCPDVYFATGMRTVLDFLRELETHGFAPGRFERILEFGVGLGRLIRHFVPLDAERFGCDVTSDALDFTRRVLGPLVMLAPNGLEPPLPYDAAMFDFVYANSVFTHIQMAATEPWIAELRRVLRPGGALIVTVFEANQYLGHLSQREFDRMADGPGYLEWGTSDVNERFMYLTPQKLCELWGRDFEVLELRSQYRDQSHLILRRR